MAWGAGDFGAAGQVEQADREVPGKRHDLRAAIKLLSSGES
jgi:hypothetical protein